jgi:hypothetical protein
MIKPLKHGRSGQILVITTLIVALIMTSTATYIYETSRNLEDAEPYLLNDYVRSIEIGSRHAVVSALANMTRGGLSQTLATNLDKWKSTVEKQYAVGKLTLTYTLRSIEPYTFGYNVVWGNSGTGVSEAYASFLLKASGDSLEMQVPDYSNVSTSLRVEGFITLASPNITWVTVKCRLFNEDQSVLAKNLTLYYRDSTQWTVPTQSNNYVAVNYGNGTYQARFSLVDAAIPVDVSALVVDGRNVVVRADATCWQR